MIDRKKNRARKVNNNFEINLLKAHSGSLRLPIRGHFTEICSLGLTRPLLMASPGCYTCLEQQPRVQCTICSKHYCDRACTPNALVDHRFIGDFICGSACSVAFMAGVIHAQAPRHFTCDFPGCRKSYEKRKQLTAHTEAVHSNVRHGPCPCCGVTYARRAALVQHLKRKRQQISEELRQPDPKPNAADRVLAQSYADDCALITAHTPMLCCNCT